MLILEAVRCGGTGTAGNNLATQLPLVVAEFPEVAQCHLGTLNLQLSLPLIVLAPDHRSKPIRWHPSAEQTEVFDILRIEIEAPTGAPRVPAWLYIAHGSPHRSTPNVHEVIGPHFALTSQAHCRIHIDRQFFQVTYSHAPIIFIV